MPFSSKCHSFVSVMDFGMIYERRTGFGTPYKFNGKELDCESGYYYYGARYYDPKFGRFLGVDPIAGDFPHLSSYNYAENSPVTNIDLHGLQKAHNSFVRLNVNFEINNGRYGGSVKVLGTRYGFTGDFAGTPILSSDISTDFRNVSSSFDYSGYVGGETRFSGEGGLFFGGSLGTSINDQNHSKTDDFSFSLGPINLNQQATIDNASGTFVERESSTSLSFGGSGGIGIIGGELNVELEFPGIKRKMTDEMQLLISDQKKYNQADNTRVDIVPFEGYDE